mgnify:CR=1 FL=1
MTGIIVDAHLDLGYNAVALGRDLRLPLEEVRARERQGQVKNTCMVTFPELRRGNVAIVGGSLFVEPAHSPWPAACEGYHNAEEAYLQARTQLETYRRWSDEGELRFLRTLADLDALLLCFFCKDTRLHSRRTLHHLFPENQLSGRRFEYCPSVIFYLHTLQGRRGSRIGRKFKAPRSCLADREKFTV